MKVFLQSELSAKLFHVLDELFPRYVGKGILEDDRRLPRISVLDFLVDILRMLIALRVDILPRDFFTWRDAQVVGFLHVLDYNAQSIFFCVK